MTEQHEYRIPTPEEIDASIREGRRLRAEAIRSMLGFGKKAEIAEKPAQARGKVATA